ncbi:hypothetical protein [Pseudonocardia alni]|uniref:hypothetical protein n=2 Tax=Pseudonocardia TaxID=1847 RepID=UPI001371D41F|nr:hypothetical protein [Pseudonocardia sp. SID8383]
MSAPPTVADLVHAGVRRTDATRVRACARYDRGALPPIEWRTAMAALYAREARWWEVLARATVADHTIPLVYIAAVGAAQAAARRHAEEWERGAAEYARLTTTARVA